MTTLESTSRTSNRRAVTKKRPKLSEDIAQVLPTEGTARALVVRIVRDLSARVELASRAVIETAVAQASATEALFELLRATSGETGKVPDPLMKARIRGLERRMGYLEYGGQPPFTAEQMAQILDVSRQSINTWRHEGRILGVTVARRGFVYPAWQIDEIRQQIIDGLPEILANLDSEDPWSAVLFLTSPNSTLDGGIPIDLLRNKAMDASRTQVIRASKLWRTHGAP